MERIQRLPYNQPAEVVPGVTLTYLEAGHILGSAIVQLDYQENGRPRRFVFTGDLGRRNTHLLPDPTPIQNIDILVSESTYGNRELDPYDRLMKQLHAIIARATRLQSKIVIPAFSLGRTQRMVYCLQELFAVHKVRPIPIYVDSPLSMRLTEIHREHPDAFTPHARGLMDKDPLYFGSKYVEFCATWDDSRRLNHLSGPMVIIASAGMCEAGRIRHHLRHVVSDPDCAIVIVSYQAEGTLGPPDRRRSRAGPDLRPVVRPQCRGLRARWLLRPRRPERPGLVVRADRRQYRARLPRARRARVHGRAHSLPPALRANPRPHPRDQFQLRSLRINPSLRRTATDRVLQPPVPRDLSVELLQAQRSDHRADRRPRVVRPE